MKRAFTIWFSRKSSNGTLLGKKKALIVQGGWEGHLPKEISGILAGILREENFDVEISDTLDVFLDLEKLKQVDLIVPVWTVGTLTEEQLNSFLSAVESGTGVAGLHGGLMDAFRGEIRYQLMIGGQFVWHPEENVTYRVHITDPNHPLVKGIPDFSVTSEQYYILVDPANEVLATTYFEGSPPEVWRPVVMPTVWIKKYGKGRVYANALGHSPDIVTMPQVTEMIKRGMVWAAR
jgi:type 1 glutamine amidotransferase